MAHIIERTAGHDRPRGEVRTAARRGIEHPLRNLKRTATILSVAPKDRKATSNHRRDDRDLAPVPWMPAVEALPLLDNVGVLLSGCTIASGRTPVWIINRPGHGSSALLSEQRP
jgi:hypothetical protein